MFWIAIAALVGIIAAESGAIWLVGIGPITGIFLVQRQRIGVIFAIITLAAGSLFFALHSQRVSQILSFPLLTPLSGHDTKIEVSGIGQIDSEVRRYPNSLRATILLRELNVRGQTIDLTGKCYALLQLEHSESKNLEYGSNFQFEGRIEQIETASSPEAFDPSEYYFRSAKSLTQIIIGPADHCQQHNERRGSQLRHTAYNCRQWMEQALTHGVGENDLNRVGSVILAMVLGAREKSPADIEEWFRLSGTIHIFAVSGLHVGVVATILWLILRSVGLSRRSAALIMIPAVLFYALLTGLRPSSFRAAIMLSVFLTGFAIKHKPEPINTLGIAALILLALDSHQLFLPGFQLSFVVVVSILLTAKFISTRLHSPFAIDEFIPSKRISNRRKHLDTLAHYIAMLTGLSIASWLGSIGLMNIHFGGITLTGILANIVMVPIAGWVIFVAAMAIGFYAIRFTIITALLNQINILIVTFLTALAQYFSALPGAHIHTGNLQAYPKANMLIDIMGIRGESAILATNPTTNRHWMIDCGNRATFQQQVLPLARQRGINRIDCIMLTHGDSGHIGASIDVVQQLHPLTLLESPFPYRSRVYGDLVALCEKRSIARAQISAGQNIRWRSNGHWEILYPDRAKPPTTGAADDRALIIKLHTTTGWKILFTSDCGFLVEQTILKQNTNLKADIWVRGQHQASPMGSVALINRVTPEVIVSTQSDFPYHERLDTEWVEMIHNAGIKLFTLDRIGSARLAIEPNQILVHPSRHEPTYTLSK